MATPQPMGNLGELHSSSSRLVWVLNRDVKSYKATFQGTKIEIPPNYQRIPKRAHLGGNLMPYLDAVEFVRDLKEAQEWKMDTRGQSFPVFGVKALFEEELSDEERESLKIPTSNSKEMKIEAAKEEKKVRRNLSKELDKIPNKVAAGEDDE